MKNYNIIKDDTILKSFISDVLPDLNKDEVFYVCLMTRSKYTTGHSHIKSDKQQLKRFISKKENLYNKIKKLEVQIGLYTQNDKPIPIESLALYITHNPRCMIKATKSLSKKLIDVICDNNYTNLQQLALSEIHKAKSRTFYIDVDIDINDKNFTKQIYYDCFLKKIINYDAFHLLHTRGGYHLLIKPDLISENYKKTFYKEIMKHNKSVDIVGDNMIPIPGTVQGGYIPYYEL